MADSFGCLETNHITNPEGHHGGGGTVWMPILEGAFSTSRFFEVGRCGSLILSVSCEKWHHTIAGGNNAHTHCCIGGAMNVGLARGITSSSAGNGRASSSPRPPHILAVGLQLWALGQREVARPARLPTITLYQFWSFP